MLDYEALPEYIEGPVITVCNFHVAEWLRGWLERRPRDLPRLCFIWREGGMITLYGVFKMP